MIMNRRQRLRTLCTVVTLVAGGALTAGNAFAAEGMSGGYATATGQYVNSAYDKCVRTGTWTKDDVNKVCNPELFAAEEAPEPAVAQAAPPVPKTVMKRVTLQADTYFQFDKAELTVEGKQRLNDIADAVKGTENQSINITGYTDRIGPEQYNKQLSLRRAEAVKDYLVGKGVPAGTVQVSGLGDANPVVQCEGKKGASLIECLGPNRRSEIEFSAFEPVQEEGQPMPQQAPEAMPQQ
jgi:OOP family OmpA-OmpF porin